MAQSLLACLNEEFYPCMYIFIYVCCASRFFNVGCSEHVIFRTFVVLAQVIQGDWHQVIFCAKSLQANCTLLTKDVYEVKDSCKRWELRVPKARRISK